MGLKDYTDEKELEQKLIGKGVGIGFILALCLGTCVAYNVMDKDEEVCPDAPSVAADLPSKASIYLDFLKEHPKALASGVTYTVAGENEGEKGRTIAVRTLTDDPQPVEINAILDAYTVRAEPLGLVDIVVFPRSGDEMVARRSFIDDSPIRSTVITTEFATGK